ncbi:hypothetical protein HPB50_020869 [Hyalomma asiaticum]|uniref:Uncharacterized protein n=1 Tax=Hyalomma asiaticum TaxID=266040 RepID=A0ACB7RSF4_HYAAI|nr:hypothetical protein HPB50_020869 [Hyalomma asiaticum]
MPPYDDWASLCSPALQVMRGPEGKHILDASLETLNCDPVPVLLPLVVNPRGASDTAVGTNSVGSGKLDQRRLSAENAVRRLRLRPHQSSEGDQEKAVIAEALKDIRRHIEPSPQESSGETPGPSELEELMEESSLATTSGDTSSSQDNTGHKSSDSTSEETSEASEHSDVYAVSGGHSAASGKNGCPPGFQSAATNYDLLSSVTSCLDPVVDHAEPLYTMRNVYQNIAQAYDTVFSSASQIDKGKPLFLGENQKQSVDSCSACYDSTNHEYLNNHERLPGGAFERFISSSQQSDVEGQQQVVSRVPDLLCGDDCQFQSSQATPQFKQVPLNAELRVAVPHTDGASGGSSMIPSVDEKSFINFLFSTMSNDNVGEDVAVGGQPDLFQVHSNVGFLNENVDTFNGNVTPAVIADYNNNVFGFHDSLPGYQDLATVDETEGPKVPPTTTLLLSEPTDGSTSAASTETSGARTAPAALQTYQPALGEERRMTATQVYQVELFNMAPEFLRALHEKDDVNAEKGLVFAPSARNCGAFLTEPERNYDLLKPSPERCSWAKARTPFYDGNSLTPELIAVAEETPKFRRRNGRNFFSDGNILGDAIGGGCCQEKRDAQVLDEPTCWALKDHMMRFAPLRPVFIGERRLCKPRPLKPVFLRQVQQPLQDWTEGDTTTVDINLSRDKKLSPPANAHSRITDDKLNTEDILTGLQEDNAMLTPLLLESRVPDGAQQRMAPESTSSEAGSSDPSEAFGTSSFEESKDSSCAATSLSTTEDVEEESARTSTTAASAAAPASLQPQQRAPLHAKFRVYENDLDATEPQSEPLGSLSTGVAASNWAARCSAVSVTDEAEFDGSAPLFDFASAAPSDETIEVGGFNEVYPGSTKKTVAVRAMMPTIDEED